MYKRPLDLLILLTAHALLLPLWILAWIAIPLAIWLEDRGPVFYVQERVGRDGRVFRLFKFRSMRSRNADEPWAENTFPDDPRVTFVGRVLRRTAMDELPQVINLWRGDISFVGPRALPVQMHKRYVSDEPRFVERLQATPGLTGLAQIYLARHCEARKRLRYDLLYIRKAGLWLDLTLVAISIWLTLKGRWGSGPREPEPRTVTGGPA